MRFLGIPIGKQEELETIHLVTTDEETGDKFVFGTLQLAPQDAQNFKNNVRAIRERLERESSSQTEKE